MEQELLFGKYRIVRLISNGSGGEVFLAEHRILGEQRIMKRLYKNRPFYKERLGEAHILKRLHHKSIPCIYDIEEDETASYIIEQNMGGTSLNEILIGQTCLPTSVILHYSIQLCEIIEYLHNEGILYLDIKPENILINDDRIYLVDFGAAIRKKEEQNVIFGTVGFAAPEQYQGAAEERSDVYGIGRMIGMMLEKGKKKSKELYRIYEQCVQPVPEKRFERVSDLRICLEFLLKGKKEKKRDGRNDIPRYVGVIGVHDGADTAAVCTLLAGYFSEREKGRIACIDLSGQFVFFKLYESLYGKRAQEEFILRGVHYITGATPAVIGDCVANGYAGIIINFGVSLELFREEFYRCDCRFAVGDLYPWRICDWESLAKGLSKTVLQSGITALVRGGSSGEMPVHVWKTVYLPVFREVLYADRKTERFFRKLF